MSLTLPREEGGTRDSETLEIPVLSRPVSSLCLSKLVAQEVLPLNLGQESFEFDEPLQTQADFLRCSQRAVGGGFFGGKRKDFTAYHVIANRTLTFYASDSKLDPLGTLPLLDASIAVEARESQLLLSLRPVGHATVHVMELTTGESKEWIDAFKKHGAVIRMPLLEDWMWKTGSKMTRWHKRKFVFFEDAIEYFKPDAEDKEMGSIPMIPGLAVKVMDTVGNVGEGETPFTFCISYRTPAEERDYVINATSEAQRDRWINKIREITGQPPARKFHTSFMEGYLYKSTGRDSWQRMFAVLNDMDLAFYRVKYEGVPAFTIPLSATSEANPQDRGTVSTFMLWEKGDEGSKTHLIRCADDNTTLTWARAINYHCNSKLVKKHPDSLKEGYLVLCPPPESSGIFEGQRRHYFVLVKNSLMYYKKREDTKPAGEIAMTGNAFVYLEQGVNGDKPAFSCAPSGDEGVKKTYLQAKDSAQRIEWVNAIVENVKTMRTKKVEDSVLEGYMFLSGLKVSKRYFVLTHNSLDWYKKRADTTRQAGVELLPESEAVFEDEEKGDFVFSVAASGDEGSKKTFISCYSDSDQTKWVQAINDIIEAKNVKLNPHSVKEGYLWKDNSSHNYNKRYFVLLSDRMLYYAKRKDAMETGKEKGFISLPGGTRVERQEGNGSGKRGKVFPFQVEPCGDEGARVYALEACSTKARDLWMEAIVSVLPKNSAVNSLSVLEGYLNKSDKNGKNWHKRYFVLWQDKLLYYKQKPVGDEDKKEAGRLEFTYDSSVSAANDPKMPFMFQVCPAGDENSRRYFMQAEDEAMMNKWVNVIGTLIGKRAQEKRDPDSLMEEFLSISNGGSSYRKRYCCLYPDRVLMYLSKFDKKESSVIELTANSFVAMQDSKIGIFYLGQDCLIRTGDAKKAEKWMVAILRLCSKMKKVPLFGGTLNDGCYLSSRRVPLLCYEIVIYLLPKIMEMTNLQSGNKEIVASIQQQYEEGKKVDLTQYGWQEALDVLVLYLKETGSKSCLIIPRVSADLVLFLKPKSFLPEDFSAIRAALSRLDENRLLLTRWILYFLSQVAASKNRISAELCAMRFTPVMLDCSTSSSEPVLSPTAASAAAAAAAKKSPPSKSLAPPTTSPTHQDSPSSRTRHSFSGEAPMSPPPPMADSLSVDELQIPAGRSSRAGSTVVRSDAATKMESLQRLLTNLIEFYDELFPGGIPKTYRGRGQQLHHWTETRDESGKIVYFNTQTKQRQTEMPGPFKRNASDWTFADLLAHKSGLDRMHAFAMNSHNAENLEFYLAVKTYRETEFKEKEAMVESAFALYRKFVDANAVSQVNIGDKLRLPLDALFASGNQEAFQKLTSEQQKEVFTGPQAEVCRLIETNEFRNFVKSQDFKDHLAALAETLT